MPHLRTQASTAPAEAAIYRKLRGDTVPYPNGVVPDGAAVVPELAPTSQRIPTLYDLIMANTQGGRTRTLLEWRTLLARGGFSLAHVYPLRASTGQAVLEATIM